MLSVDVLVCGLLVRKGCCIGVLVCWLVCAYVLASWRVGVLVRWRDVGIGVLVCWCGVGVELVC